MWWGNVEKGEIRGEIDWGYMRSTSLLLVHCRQLRKTVFCFVSYNFLFIIFLEYLRRSEFKY